MSRKDRSGAISAVFEGIGAAAAPGGDEILGVHVLGEVAHPQAEHAVARHVQGARPETITPVRMLRDRRHKVGK